MKIIPILFTFDDKLVIPACVAITSLLHNALPDTFYDIFIVHPSKYNLASSKLNTLTATYSNCKITFRPVSGEFEGGYEIRGIPETCYYRMISAELIPEYDKILYSDVDVIFREDLSKYYEIDLGNNCFAGVDNGSSLRPEVQDYVTKVLKADVSKGYFYSGNLIINLKQIRTEGLCNVFRSLGKNAYKQQDMDIINIACNGRFLQLSPEFCLTAQLYEMIINRRPEMLMCYSEKELEAALNHGIIHYNGAKPWNTWCHHFDIWWEYYRMSPVYEESYYSEFYQLREKDIDNLSFVKRLKLVARYFISR